jgi:integrase
VLPLDNEEAPGNHGAEPLRLLKRGFASYTDAGSEALAALGKEPRVDEERDRRLTEGEEEQIQTYLEGRADEQLLFEPALQTAMRMRECYTLQSTQVNLARRMIFLERAKNGSSRQVPLPIPMVQLLSEYVSNHRQAIASRGDRLLPFWDGNLDDVPSISPLGSFRYDLHGSSD